MFFNLEVDKYLAVDAQLRFTPIYAALLTYFALLAYCCFTAGSLLYLSWTSISHSLPRWTPLPLIFLVYLPLLYIFFSLRLNLQLDEYLAVAAQDPSAADAARFSELTGCSSFTVACCFTCYFTYFTCCLTYTGSSSFTGVLLYLLFY